MKIGVKQAKEIYTGVQHVQKTIDTGKDLKTKVEEAISPLQTWIKRHKAPGHLDITKLDLVAHVEVNMAIGKAKEIAQKKLDAFKETMTKTAQRGFKSLAKLSTQVLDTARRTVSLPAQELKGLATQLRKAFSEDLLTALRRAETSMQDLTLDDQARAALLYKQQLSELLVFLTSKINIVTQELSKIIQTHAKLLNKSITADPATTSNIADIMSKPKILL